MNEFRKTKIVATLGPSCGDKESIKTLIESGMDAARLNFSHGDYSSHEQLIENVKAARAELGAPTALMLDTKGPEIRIQKFKDGAVTLEKGAKFTLTTDEIEGDETQVSINYSGLPGDISAGKRILLDDGLIELVADIVDGNIIECSVLNGGVLKNNKGVNVPDVSLSLPALTERDIEDILFGIKMDVDYIAASFIRNVNDINQLKRVLEKNGGSHIRIIAKIENGEGVSNIDSILDATHGIMVARGDLGVEILPEEVPIVQKDLIRKANKKGKLVITATQMLDSMMNNPRPTRAEANDVANAIFDGTDAVMLSGETASGKYPSESVSMMARIALKTESAIDYYKGISSHDFSSYRTSITDAISYATCTTAADIKAGLIATVTYSGFTARMVSKFRPPCPILAITANPTVSRQMNLICGCIPLLCDDISVYDDVFAQSVKFAEDTGLVSIGDLMIIVAGVPVGMTGTTNTIRVATVGNILLKGESSSEKIITARTCVVKNISDAEQNFQPGDILVCQNTRPELMPFIRRACAIIAGSDEPQDYEHALTSGEALDIPVLICQEKVHERIPSGIVITLDSKKGIIYNGKYEAHL